ncbi:hypothetical protein BS47DRAFT_460947 [Hydnum rufescens UP504]|uniref:Uncharacterized protein n=1 Tax=Hydnum rufescens UP504 TaxID=1448309 RepID=A0A9P6AJP1_9AGAM|nr:hypothetical protein BS47DRAFT_460947 [Hydnum rufescens UP504]
MRRVPLFAALFLTIEAATNITVPTSLRQCQLVHVNVTGDPPLHLEVVSSSLHNQTLDDLGSLNGTTTSVPWVVDIIGGTRVQFLVKDKTGAQTFSHSIVIKSTKNSTCLFSNPSNEFAKVQPTKVQSSKSLSASTLSRFLGASPTAPVVLPHRPKKAPAWIIPIKPRVTRVSIIDDYEIIEPSLRLPQHAPNWNRTSVAPSIYGGNEDKAHFGSGDDLPEEEQGLVAHDTEAPSKRNTGRPSILTTYRTTIAASDPPKIPRRLFSHSVIQLMAVITEHSYSTAYSDHLISCPIHPTYISSISYSYEQ